MVQPLLQGYFFTWSWDAYTQKIIGSLCTSLWNVSKILCNLLSMLVVKETRILPPVLLEKLWCCLQTARMVIKLWIAVVIQSQSVWMMKTHTQRWTIKVSRDWGVSAINFKRYSLPNVKSNRKDQSLYASLYWSSIDWEFWSSNTFFLQNLAVLTSMRRRQWIPIQCI